jgi:hypothetical protein
MSCGAIFCAGVNCGIAADDARGAGSGSDQLVQEGSGASVDETRPGWLGTYYFITRPAAGGELSYEYTVESRTSSGVKTEDAYHRYRERLRLKSEGWVYHPALLEFSLMFEPEFTQAQDESEGGGSGSSGSFSPDYALNLSLLKEKNYPVRLGASRREEPVWAPFSGTTETLVEAYDGSLQLKYPVFPMVLSVAHVETEQEGYYMSSSVRDTVNMSSHRSSARSNTNIWANYSDDQRTTDGRDSWSKNLTAGLINRYRPFDEKQIRLNSSLTYRDQQTASLDTLSVRLREHLNWRHRKNLQTNYIFTHDYLDSGDTGFNLTTLEARLTHLLYENLTTDAGARTEWYSYDGSREDGYTGFLDLDYERAIPGGELLLNTGWEYQYTTRTGGEDSVVQVNGETHALSTGEETYLDHYGVELDSIVVASLDGSAVYIEGIDYSIEVIGDYVRVNRLPFGAITEGQVVSIRYRYLAESDYDDALFTQNYGVTLYLFEKWRFSYSFVGSNQDILSGQVPRQSADYTRHRAEVRHELSWHDLTLTYEDYDRQSDLSYSQWKVQEVLRYRPGRRLYFTIRGYLGETKYKERDEVRDFYGGVGTIDWLLSRRLKLRGEGYYESIDGESEQMENTGLKLSLEFRYRIWKTQCSYEVVNRDNLLTDYYDREQRFLIELIRLMW